VRGRLDSRPCQRRAFEFCEPPLEEAPLGVRVDELERAVIGGAGVFDTVEPAQQLAAHGWDVVGASSAGMSSVWVERLERRWPFPTAEPPRASDLVAAAGLVLSGAL
jgi:hypothetical protein